MKELLKKIGLTQAGLAHKIGKSQRLVSAWCNGQCQPQLEILPKLAEILDVSVEEIIQCFTSETKKAE